MSKEKYPKKRFEGFSKEWQFKELEKLTSTFTDGDWIESKDQSDSGVRLIQTGNIGVTKFLDKPQNKKWVSEGTFTKLNCEEIFPGDILISRLPEPAGRATIVPQLNTRMITAVDCTIVRPSSEYSSDFLIQYLSTSNYFNEITAELAGGTRQRISRSNLAEIKVPVPETLKEQEEIGSFFKKIDRMIQLQQSKVNKVKDIKSAYLSEMFPKEGEKYPKKRFEGFTEPWSEHTLGEVAQIKTGNTNVQDAVPDGRYTFFDRSTDIKRIDKFYYDEKTIIYPGEGSEFYPRYFSGKYALHQRAYAITSDIINLEYLANMMMLRNNHFVNNAVGSTVKSLRMENFKKCKVFVPSIDEQKKIAQLFKNINNQILIEEEKLVKLEKLKQAYLNDMFV